MIFFAFIFSLTSALYKARHSWASIAKNKNIPLSVISESMGHNSENTTKIYLLKSGHHRQREQNHSERFMRKNRETDTLL